jgi:DNA polymerase-3 subunit delta'
LQSRYQTCQKGSGFCGSCLPCRIRTKRHPDVLLVEPEKTTISIEQVRTLINEVAFQPLEARYRVVILDPAEQMRQEAHNSLLKTLEEPSSRTIFILITANPYMLLETIRSRCRILQFGGIPQDQIERYLAINEERSAEEAQLAAVLSGGSLENALAFNTKDYAEIRREALNFADLLLKKGEFAKASMMAANIAREKQFFQSWIEAFTVLLQDIYYAKIAPERVGQRDLLEPLGELAQSVPRSAIVSAIHMVNRLKSALQYNVSSQLALEASFLSTIRGLEPDPSIVE